MKKTNKSAGVQYKLIFYYALFALLPMFLIAVFTRNMKKIQLERLYEELSYQMEHTIKIWMKKQQLLQVFLICSIWIIRCRVILQQIIVREDMEDLYSYVDDLSNVKIFNPDITKISVYTSKLHPSTG